MHFIHFVYILDVCVCMILFFSTFNLCSCSFSYTEVTRVLSIISMVVPPFQKNVKIVM
jgi:hypothetical protein